jgi:hypothetical protein
MELNLPLNRVGPETLRNPRLSPPPRQQLHLTTLVTNPFPQTMGARADSNHSPAP